jgi:hypothetical protein
LWNGCGSSFTSLEELITHVNISHLRTYSSGIPEPFADLSSYMRLSQDALSCQWDNCHEFSSTSVSSNLRLDALNSLAGHLFHDHLGLQDGPEDHVVISANHAALVDVGLPVPVPDLSQDVEMRAEERGSDNKRQGMPLARNVKQNDINKPKNERRPTAGEAKRSKTAGVTEKCHWRGCEHSFESVDDLMNHLTVVHVGSGKNHYECFWDGCERNGQNGFGSKQKVCRHLQVRIFPSSAMPFNLICKCWK